MSDEIIETVEETVDAQPKRGRPKKVELPETTMDDIESIEEVVEEVVVNKQETEENNVVESKKEEQAETTPISKPETKEEPKHKYHTANYLHKKGEEVYLVHFSGQSDEQIFGTIIEKYIFRPFKTRVREVLIDENNSISYRLDSCQGCFTERLVTKTLEECKKICDIKNMRQ